MGTKKSDKIRIKTLKCLYYDRGYCKHGDECFNKHPNNVCEDEDCFGENCEKRHPNPCKFGIRCKFNRKKLCSYLHATFVPNDGKIDALVNEFNKKFEVLENELKKELREK